MPDPLYDLLLRCWHIEKSKRPDMTTVANAIDNMIYNAGQFDISDKFLNQRVHENAGVDDQRIKVVFEKKQFSTREADEQITERSMTRPFNRASIVKRNKKSKTRVQIVNIHDIKRTETIQRAEGSAFKPSTPLNSPDYELPNTDLASRQFVK